jgi:hypothetical protein
MSQVYAAMMNVPLEVGYFPERWKHVKDVMLEKIPGMVISDKLHIIQLLEADMSQVMCIAFARNITKLAKKHVGIVSAHQYSCPKKIADGPTANPK